jgi:predicted kinase
MELKRFVGADSKATMDQVRAHYGADALIISTNKVGNKTEMICAVEEPQAQTGTPQQSVTESAKSLDISEATSTVASLLNRVAADAAAEGLPAANLGSSKSDERIAREFGQELNSALGQRQNAGGTEALFVSSSPVAPSDSPTVEPTPSALPDHDDMHQMMQTIQEDLARLRAQLEAKAAAETPLHKAQLAMASINQHVKEQTSAGCSGLVEQMQGFLRHPLAQQRDWSGAHVFVGHPGAGKSTTIASLIQQTLQADATANLMVISLGHEYQQNLRAQSGPIMLADGGLAQLCQNSGVAFLQANSLDQLTQLLTRYRQNHQLLIDTPADLLQDQQALVSLVTENEILPHLCVAADMSPAVLSALKDAIPWIVSSVIVTRFDLAPDLTSLLNTLEFNGAQLSGINGHLIDNNVDPSEKINSTNTLEE